MSLHKENNMKYTALLAFLFIAFGTCAQKVNSKKKIDLLPGVHGQIIGGAGSKLYLVKSVNRVQTKIDSVQIQADGSFHLIPEKSLNLDYYNLVLGEVGVMLITDSTEVVGLTADASAFRITAVWTGSQQTHMMQTLINELDPIVNEQQSFIQIANDPNLSAEERMDAKTKYNASAASAGNHLKEWIKMYEAHPAALVALMSLQPSTDLALFRNELALLNDKVGNTDLYALVKTETEKAEKALKQSTQQPPQSSAVSKGMQTPEISLPNPEGNIMKLSDLKGKVVLIDFWASWCGPCRKENPNVVKAYEKYSARGFEVFSVSLDTDRGRWIQSIEQDKLTWSGHVSDLKGWSSTAASDYGVRSIPFPVLIDQEGKVVAFGGDVRGPALEILLEQLLGK